MAPQIDAVPLAGLLDEKSRLVWEHNGECGCGRRTYRFGQCMKCLEEELTEEVDSAIAEDTVAVALQVCTAGEILHPGATARPQFRGHQNNPAPSRNRFRPPPNKEKNATHKHDPPIFPTLVGHFAKPCMCC